MKIGSETSVLEAYISDCPKDPGSVCLKWGWESVYSDVALERSKMTLMTQDILYFEWNALSW